MLGRLPAVVIDNGTGWVIFIVIWDIYKIN